MAQLFVGTSGFAYASWKPEFYPPTVSSKNFLAHYAQRLNAVEINYTFRQSPSGTMLAKWLEDTPNGFVFALKAHQRITHFLRLKDAGAAVKKFLQAVEPLRKAGRMGPVLFQLPPQFRCDEDRLRQFLMSLPEGRRYAFEFRHESWFDQSIYRLLERHNACLCLAESESLQTPEVFTADFVYCRLRQPDYTPQDRRKIAARVRKFLDASRDAYVFFKHEESPAGALHAEELLKRAGNQKKK